MRFALAVALFLAATANFSFWQRTLEALWVPSPPITAFFIALALVLALFPLVLLVLAPAGWPMKLVASVLVVVACAAGYFMDSMGSPMTAAMMRNVLETDAAEVRDLLSLGLVTRILLLAVVPLILIWKVQFVQMSGWRGAGQRALVAGGVLLALVGSLAFSAPVMAVFLREHKVLRAYANPVAPMWNFFAALSAGKPVRGPLINPAEQVGARPAASQPRVFVLVLGETARAANFQLNGYGRPTNPRLSRTVDVTYFPKVTSCGTSTAESVPCMFSHLGQAGSRKDRPERYENLLDTLSRAGVRVLWFDNNSGCKGVCARVESVSFMDEAPRSVHPDECRGMHCWDSVLNASLASTLETIDRDTLVVLHQVGSHGPAYAERYPPEFGRYTPVCELGDLSRCDRQSLVNAYDNTILYTDHIVAQNIEALKRHESRFQEMLLYVSDHGESLGEGGLYLHGLPRALAPEFQTHVPLLAWMPAATRERLGIGSGCLAAEAARPVTHDNLYHTIAGYFGYTGKPYRADLDLVRPCPDDPAS